MRESKILVAMREGFAAGMRADENTFLVGEGIAKRGGCFAETVGLFDEFGSDRVMDMPLSENTFLGMCAGAAMSGTRAICDVMYSDFLTVAMSQLVDQAIKIPYLSGGRLPDHDCAGSQNEFNALKPTTCFDQYCCRRIG